MRHELPENANAALGGGGAAGKKNENDKHQSIKRSVIRRQGRCRHCAVRFDMPTTGRQKRFCSDQCRVASAREKAVFERAGCIAPDVTKPSQQVIENIAALGTTKPTHTSRFSIPVDVLGRGYKWPGAERLDRKILANIAWREIGGA